MQLKFWMQQYGRAVAIHDPRQKVQYTHAFIQPLRYKNKMYLFGVNTEIGYNSQGHYLYIGPAEQDLTTASDDAYLQAGREKYQIDRAEMVYLQDKPLYVWAVIRTIVE